MNRLLAVLPEPHGPTDAVSIGSTLPQILKGPVPVANLPLGPEGPRPMPTDRPEIGRAFDRLYAGNDPQSEAYRQGRAARAELVDGLASEMRRADNGAPPPAGFPAEAQRLAHLISRDTRIRMIFLSLGGWDTHVNQGKGRGQLANRMQPLGDGLAAFARGLGEAWDDTIVVVLSEFGRTVRENGNGSAPSRAQLMAVVENAMESGARTQRARESGQEGLFGDAFGTGDDAHDERTLPQAQIAARRAAAESAVRPSAARNSRGNPVIELGRISDGAPPVH